MSDSHAQHRRNLLFELHGGPLCRADGATLVTALERVAAAAGLQVMGRLFHDFQPAGATAALLLSESHLTAHTWPEEEYVAVDLFTCSPTTDAATVKEALRAAFAPREIAMREVRRG
jgi:S-adenosylmethionine decarboxylase